MGLVIFAAACGLYSSVYLRHPPLWAISCLMSSICNIKDSFVLVLILLAEELCWVGFALACLQPPLEDAFSICSGSCYTDCAATGSSSL